METYINFSNKDEFYSRYNKIYKLLPYYKYDIEDFERTYTFSLRYKKIDYFIKDLEWDKNLIDIILNISKKYIGNYYEVNKKNPEKKKFLLDNKNTFYLYIFHIILLLSSDVVSEKALNYRINFIQKFFCFYCFNDTDLIKNLECAKKFLLFLISLRENFIGYIFHFYLNLPNLLNIKSIGDLLSIKKINGDFNMVYNQSHYFALFDINVRNSFKRDDTTIVIENRDKLFKNIFDCFLGKIDNIENSLNLKIIEEKNKIRKSLFKYSRKEFSFENLIELKEFFSPFRMTFYLIYGHFYESSGSSFSSTSWSSNP